MTISPKLNSRLGGQNGQSYEGLPHAYQGSVHSSYKALPHQRASFQPEGSQQFYRDGSLNLSLNAKTQGLSISKRPPRPNIDKQVRQIVGDFFQPRSAQNSTQLRGFKRSESTSSVLLWPNEGQKGDKNGTTRQSMPAQLLETIYIQNQTHKETDGRFSKKHDLSARVGQSPRKVRF